MRGVDQRWHLIPPRTPPAARWPSTRRPFPRRVDGRSARPRSRAASVPYLLVAPVVVAIVAILGYPLYKLVTLSFQQYGLPELIQRHGEWIGLENYRSVLVGQRLLGHARADDRLHRGERRPDDGARDADRAAPAAALDARPHPAHVGARARLVDAGRRRRPGLVLDDELPERHPQLRPHRARRRRLLPARLVRLAVLAARDGHGPDRLGRDPVRDGDGLRGARAGAARARRGGADRRRRARCASSATSRSRC